MSGTLFCDRAGSGNICRLINGGSQTGPFGKFISIVEVMDVSDLRDKGGSTNKSNTRN